MARVVVIGGGYGGMAAAVRLAKLGHQVALMEAGRTLGGALGRVEAGGFAWDAGPASTGVPAVVRDLFRKSGRPLEDELSSRGLTMEQRAVLRTHRFEDRTELRMPGTSRGDQVAAFDALNPGQGDHWWGWLEAGSVLWEALRRPYFEEPWHRGSEPPEARRILAGRENLQRRVRAAFRDDRLASVATFAFQESGHHPRDVPAWAAMVHSYLEATFGVWTIPGGLHHLATLLEERLRTREVRVLLECPALDLVVREGRVVAVRTGLGVVDADVVVCAVDPRRLPTLAAYVERATPAVPAPTVHVGLEDPDGTGFGIDGEFVAHGPTMLTVQPGGTAPEGCVAWTVRARGTIAEDLLDALARHRLDVRGAVRTRVDRSPTDQVREWNGTPLGVLWAGRGTVRNRLGPTTPVTGVYAAGAHATPGAGLPYVGLSAAQVAAEIGPA